MSRCTIYQTGPLFSDSEREWHHKLTAALEASGHQVIWSGNLLADRMLKDATNPTRFIFHACCNAIDQCSCVVALLDGSQVDDGTAWEIGYAYAKKLPIFGIRTDFRNSGEIPGAKVNAMIEGCLTGLAKDIEELITLVL
jgi:nucleoside 2-deoxyribosyltransferase